MDSSTAVAPSISGTWFLTLISKLYAKIIKRKSSDSVNADGEDIDEADDASGTASDAPGSGTTTPKEAKGGRMATSMAGGRRRKAVRKR